MSGAPEPRPGASPPPEEEPPPDLESLVRRTVVLVADIIAGPVRGELRGARKAAAAWAFAVALGIAGAVFLLIALKELIALHYPEPAAWFVAGLVAILLALLAAILRR